MIVTTRSLSSPTGRTRPFSAHNPHSVAGSVMLAALLGLFPVVPGKPATAASFDCGKAELPLDKLICQTPDLSAKDDELAAKYKAALMQLSPEGQRIFRESQRNWLDVTRRFCKTRLDSSSKTATADTVACLRDSWTGRIGELNTAIGKIGSYRLMTVYFTQVNLDYFPRYADSPPEAAWASLAYPRIDAPVTPEARKLNATWKKWASDPTSTTNSGMSDNQYFTVETVQKDYARLVAVDELKWASGEWLPKVETRWNILLPSLKELQSSDLFRTDSAWKDALVKPCEKAFADKYPDSVNTEIDSEIETLCVDPHNWSLSRENLTILPDPYSGFAKRDQPENYEIPKVTIPWHELKPYLRADLPIKLNTE